MASVLLQNACRLDTRESSWFAVLVRPWSGTFRPWDAGAHVAWRPWWEWPRAAQARHSLLAPEEMTGAEVQPGVCLEQGG